MSPLGSAADGIAATRQSLIQGVVDLEIRCRHLRAAALTMRGEITW